MSRKFNAIKWDLLAFAANERNAAKVKTIYSQAIKEAAMIAAAIKNHKANKLFSFDDYPQTKERVRKLFLSLAGKLERNVIVGTDEAWRIANAKNDELEDMFRELTRPTRNKEALMAFQTRKEGGMKLSDRVWRNTQQARQEIELAIDVSLTEGKPAASLARDIRRHLNEPDRLFRRVRDKRGQLVLSKAAKAYHPGQGIYRSSYKNAMRVARTEVNMAYRTADHERWNNQDFVVGVEVRLSNNPRHCDVCASLKGRYPKEFIFKAWHPQCRCYAIPILMSDKDYDRLELKQLNGEDTSSFKVRNEVKDIPKGAKEWFAENKKRIRGNASIPYFITDNPDWFKV